MILTAHVTTWGTGILVAVECDRLEPNHDGDHTCNGDCHHENDYAPLARILAVADADYGITRLRGPKLRPPEIDVVMDWLLFAGGKLPKDLELAEWIMDGA